MALITLNFPEVSKEVLVTIAAYAVISAIAGKIYARLYQKQLDRGGQPQDLPGI